MCQHTPTHWIHKQCSHTTLTEYKQSQHSWKFQLHKTRTIPTITINNSKHNIPDQHTSLKHHNPTSNTQLNIIQININGIRNKILELTQLATDYKADIITIQERELTDTSKTPTSAGFTTIRKDWKQDKVEVWP